VRTGLLTAPINSEECRTAVLSAISGKNQSRIGFSGAVSSIPKTSLGTSKRSVFLYQHNMTVLGRDEMLSWLYLHHFRRCRSSTSNRKYAVQKESCSRAGILEVYVSSDKSVLGCLSEYPVITVLVSPSELGPLLDGETLCASASRQNETGTVEVAWHGIRMDVGVRTVLKRFYLTQPFFAVRPPSNM
jgi:hypothetical protein